MRQIPEISSRDISSVSTDEMIEVDRAMMEDYKIDLPRMMENAGRSLASLVRSHFLGGAAKDYIVSVMAGSGGNGRGALVAARHLSNWGADVTIFLAQYTDKMTTVPADQLGILKEMGVAIATPHDWSGQKDSFKSSDIIVDGLIGYSLRGAPKGPAGELIDMANRSLTPVISLDTPSGVDAGKGTVYQPAIEADATLTLALPKTGLFERDVAKQIGELFCADISVPPSLYSRFLSKNVGAIFSESEIIKINTGSNFD